MSHAEEHVPELPAYDDLPAASEGGRSGWGVFGPDDNVGLVNLQTPGRVVEAARLVRRGALFPLDAPLDAFTHTHWGRSGIRHTVIRDPGGEFFDDLLDNFYLQTASQWDSLAHVGYSSEHFYNGVTPGDIAAGRGRNTIDHWARRGIAARAVLLDMARTFADDGRAFEPSDTVEFSAEDFELARKRAGVEIRPGDILLFHTGFSRWFGERTHAERSAMEFTCPGIEGTESMCRYLWDLHISGLAADNLAVEAFPSDHSPEAAPFGASHNMLIGQFGLALGELWWLDDLARDCAEDGVYEMLLVSAPLHLPGGIGSPANAIAIK